MRDVLRDRGGDERELTLGELATQAKSPNPVVSKSTLLSELYGRLARAATERSTESFRQLHEIGCLWLVKG